MALMAPFECYVPKHHISYHLLAALERNGNPTWYANWVDETLNRTLKAVCKNVSQACFETVVLLRMRDVMTVGAVGGAKRCRDA